MIAKVHSCEAMLVLDAQDINAAHLTNFSKVVKSDKNEDERKLLNCVVDVVKFWFLNDEEVESVCFVTRNVDKKRKIVKLEAVH